MNDTHPHVRQDSFVSPRPYPHRIAYREWGSRGNPHSVVCAHGLTRNGRDFDALAEVLSRHYRVVCPDMPGRGGSEWLKNPADYGYPLYQADAMRLLKHLGLARRGGWLGRLIERLAPRSHFLDWVGTSMGGILGMLLATLKPCPIRRLVLNDVGAFIPAAAIARICQYAGAEPRFADLAEAERHFRQIYAPFGTLTHAQWTHLTEHSTRKLPDGGYGLAYDRGIITPLLAAPPADIDLWSLWDALRVPVLVLRGENSDLLLPETVREMAHRGPRAQVVEIPGTGHAPALMAPEQIEIVERFLLAP